MNRQIIVGNPSFFIKELARYYSQWQLKAEHFVPYASLDEKEPDMKKISVLIIVLAVFISACGPIIPGSGISTPIEITAEMSTIIAETVGPPPTDGPFPNACAADPYSNPIVFYPLSD